MRHVWGCLQGLAGLREYEAAYLREQDVDCEDKTVRVAESPAHAPKNAASHRTLPVCDAVHDALSAWIGRMEERHRDGYLFFPRKTEHQKRTAKDDAARAGAYCTDYVSRSWTHVLTTARKAGVDLPKGSVARNLRFILATAVRSLKADYADVEAYPVHPSRQCSRDITTSRRSRGSEKWRNWRRGWSGRMAGSCWRRDRRLICRLYGCLTY